MLADTYHWIVTYFDGTHLNQIDSSGAKHTYKDINRDQLATFEMWNGDTRVLLVRFKKGQRLIWRRRVETSPSGISEICHIIGKQETINGKNYQGIIGLFESDGRIEMTGKFEEGHPWFFPVKLHPHEGEVWSYQEGED